MSAVASERFLQGVHRAVAALAAVGAVVAAPACGSITAAEGEVVDIVSPASIEVAADGGIAALHIVSRVDSATGQVVYTMDPICAENASCQTRDSLEGTLTRAQVDAFFVRAAQQDFRALRADYGMSTQGADLMGYRVTIRGNDRTRTILADDLTMPAPLSEFVSAVRSAVVEAVRK